MWRRLTSQSVAIFAARLIGAATAFVTQALMARLWGPHVLGDYLFVIAAVNVAATVMPLGFQVVAGYFAAEYRAHGEGRALRFFARRSYGQAAAMALVLFAAGTAVMLFLPSMREAQALWLPAFVMAVATTTVFINGALLVGMKRPFAALMADVLFRPMLALLGFAVAATLMGAPDRLASMLWVAGLAYLAIAAIQTVVVVRTLIALPAGTIPAPAERRRWWRFALPWVVMALAGDFFFDIDLVLLSAWLGRDEIAVFGVCARICALLAFGVGTVYLVTMPDIFEAGARRDTHEFHRRVGDANLIAAALATVLATAMFATGPLLGLLFGERFAAGSLPLGILSLGLVVRAALGPASLVLSFHDMPYAGLPAAGVGFVALTAGNALLVPAFGINGAAFAALLAMTAWSSALWLTARRSVQMDVSVLPRLRTLLAGRAN